MAVEHQKGKPAITHFEVLERYRRATLVQCRLETGRTHQIRVHMKYIGHPVVGDPIYSSNYRKFAIQGQALHAQSLGFEHPKKGERIQLESELPSDIGKLVQIFRQD